MNLSSGRKEHNIDLYYQSIEIWHELRKSIKSYLLKNNLIGGNYGIIDSWCLLILQYYIQKTNQTKVNNIPRTFYYYDIYTLMREGFYNIKNNNFPLKRINRKKYLKSKLFVKKDIIFDSINISKGINDDHKTLIFDINLIIKENYKKINTYLLDDLSVIIINVLKNHFSLEESERLNKFLINTIPELYLISNDDIQISGLEAVIAENKKSFIRTTAGIIDNDLQKIIASKLKNNGTFLYTTYHGGNNFEIAYNSAYKTDETLSKKYLKPKEIGISQDLKNNKNKKFFLKRGILIYLKPKDFQNTYLFGSETSEDQPKYMTEIFDLIGSLKNYIKKEIILMRHNDDKKTNLYELNFYVEKHQIFPYKSIQKKIYNKIFKPKLKIATYLGTVFLESINANSPCVLFFNPNRYELSKEMNSIIEIMKASKILHINYESLSKFLNETKDFYKWWREPLTLEAINKFKIITNKYF